jgi:Leucine-rich repeat (LRR) protein
MRKITLIIVLVIFSTFQSVSQIINIPDEIFKNYLLGLGIDTNGDGEISSYEANAYEGPIIIDSLNISDLTGIWGLTNITFLSASYNNLTFLNIGCKYNLDTIKVDHNYLDTLIVGQCMNLKYLNCAYNNLSTVNFNYFIDKIEKLDCSFNNIHQIEFPIYIDNNLKILNCSHNNISYINSCDLSGLTQLNCSHCNIDSIAISEASNLQILDCHNNNLDDLNIHELSILETLNCSYNHIDLLNLNNSLKTLDCSNNDLSVINLGDCGDVDTIICSYNQLEELSLLYNINLNWIDFSYNPDFKKLCVNQLPLTFGKSDEGTDYVIEVCTQEFQNTFKAGQILGVLSYNSEDHYFYDSTKFDLTGDNIYDIKITSLRDGQPQYWGNINYYIQPVNQTLMSWGSFNINDLIYPPNFSWSAESMHIYYAYGDINFCCETYWWIDPYLAFKTPVGSDTIFSYIFFEETGDFGMNISNYATWTPCLSSISLGNDTIITLKDTLTLNAGSDYQGYFWNTGDTVQSVSIIGQEWGVGVWNIGVYVKKLNCYYTDTIQVQIIDDSGISETESNLLKTYPNPTKDQLKIINSGNLVCNVSLFDIHGRQLILLELIEEIEINISNYPKGIYYLHYVTKDDSGTVKIIRF